MGSGLQCDAALRYPRKCLLHCFRCRRHFLFQKDFACFIQNAVERPAIAEVQTNRELVSFENHVSIYPNSASLFHGRSPFLCALSTSNTGSVSHPAETGLLIPSDKRLSECSQIRTMQKAISDKTSCTVGTPPGMKIGCRSYRVVNCLFLVGGEAIFIAEDLSRLGSHRLSCVDYKLD